MAKKTFGKDGLNALNNAIEVVSEAMEEPSSQAIAASTTPQAPITQQTEATQQPVITASKPEQKSRVVAVQAPVEIAPAKQSTNPKKKNQEEIKEDPVQELVKGLNIPLPLSIYKRLSNMKLDSDNESLKSLGLKAVIEFLEKNGY